MMRTDLSPRAKITKPCSLVLFSIGGRRFAARIEEVGGVWPWPQAIPVPSQPPFIRSVVRQGDTLLPVFELAEQLQVSLKGDAPFCLVAKHEKGPLAIYIDEEVPSLYQVDAASLTPSQGTDTHCIGICQIDMEDVPVYSFARIGAT